MLKALPAVVFVLSALLCPLSFAADAVTVVRNVWLREGPSTSFARIHKLLPHEEADLVQWDASRGYYQVRHEGEVGWVWSRNVWRYRDTIAAIGTIGFRTMTTARTFATKC